MPTSVTPAQLEVLLNGLLAQEERLPYSFYLDESELGGPLGEHLQARRRRPRPRAAPAPPRPRAARLRASSRSGRLRS